MTPHPEPLPEATLRAPADRAPTSLSAWLTAAIACAATLWLWPGLIMELGLHGDEAYVGLAADALAHGGPLRATGMNTHTGPLHQWLVALAFFLCGPSVAALRAVGAVCNGIAVGLYARGLCSWMGLSRSLWATAMLLTLPAVSTLGAVATEHMALSPLLALGAWNLLLHAPQGLTSRGPGDVVKPLCAGVLLGLGTWTHLVFLGVPAAFGVVAWHRWGQNSWRHTWVRWVFLGWLLVEWAPFLRLSVRIKVRHGGAGILTRLAQMPQLLFETWQGKLAALRTVGASPNDSVVPWLGVVVLVVWGLMALRQRGGAPWGRLVACAWALLGMATTTAIIVPFASDRFVLLVLYVLPVVCTVGLMAWARSLRMPRGWARALGHVLCALTVLLQLQVFVRHIALPWREGLQRGNSFAVFGVPETSNHYADTRPLYEALVRAGHPDIVCQNFIGWALRFHMLASSPNAPLRIRLSDDDDSFEPRAVLQPTDRLAIYARGHRNDHLDAAKSFTPEMQLRHFTVLRPKQVVLQD